MVVSGSQQQTGPQKGGKHLSVDEEMPPAPWRAQQEESRFWPAVVVLVLQCNTLSSGILLKGNMEKQEEFETPAVWQGPRAGTHWALPVGNDFTQIEGVQHHTRPSLNALNKLQNLDLKSPREGGLNLALLKMGGKSDLLEKSILRRYYSNSGIKDYLSC